MIMFSKKNLVQNSLCTVIFTFDFTKKKGPLRINFWSTLTLLRLVYLGNCQRAYCINLCDFIKWYAEVANYTWNYTKFGKEQANSVGFIGSGSHFILQRLLFIFKFCNYLFVLLMYFYFSVFILVLPSISMILDLLLKKNWNWKKILLAFCYQPVMVYKVFKTL